MIHAAPALCAFLAAYGPPSAPDALTPVSPPHAAPVVIPTLVAEEPDPGFAAVPTLAAPQATAGEMTYFGPVVEPGSYLAAGPPGDGWNSTPPRRRDRICSEVGPPYHYERVFQPPPLGRLMHATMDVQVRNGEAALDVLHRTDFLSGEAELSPLGLRRLASIAARLPTHARPVVVEPPAAWEPDGPALAAARLNRVAELLAGGTFPVPPERVVLAADPAQGLDGTDAELVYRNLLILTGSGGKLRTRFDVFGGAAQSATAPSSAASEGSR